MKSVAPSEWAPARILRLVASFEELFRTRAALEAWRAWHRRVPWRWLPLQPWADLVRVTAFRRFGRRWADAFTRVWRREFERRAEFSTDQVRGVMLNALTSGSDRAWSNMVSVLEVEVPRMVRLTARLDDPDDELCRAVTEAVAADRGARDFTATLNRLEEEVRERIRWEGWSEEEVRSTAWPRRPGLGNGKMGISRRS